MPVALVPAALLLLLPDEPEPEVPEPPEELEPELAGAAAELELPLPLLPLEPESVDWLPLAAVAGHLARAALHWLLWATYHELTALS